MNLYNGIKALSDNYDAFIIDLWGVIHDGQELYPDVIDTLEWLRLKDKKIVFLSNAPKRSFKAAQRLDDLGINASLYDDVITSGEAVYDWIRQDETYNSKDSYIIISPDHDADLLDGLGLSITEKAESADFALVIGYGDDDAPEDEHNDVLESIRQQNLTLICANPDKVIIRRNGNLLLCAGMIADIYEDMGGEVIHVGKPYDRVYQHSLTTFQHLGITDHSRILAIGDNLETDIQGANQLGIDSILIASGILSHELVLNGRESKPDMMKLEALCAGNNLHRPTFVVPSFIL